MNNIKPLHKQILVRPNDVKQTTSSGIVLQGGDGDSRSAIVMAIGPEVQNTDIVSGTEVYLLWDKAMAFRYAGEKYAFVDEENIVAIIENGQ